MDSYLTIAEDVLREARQPLSSRDILKRAYSSDLVPHRLFGKTQHKTLQARLSEDILLHRERSVFFRTEPGRFFLREFLLDESLPTNYRRFILARRRKRDLPSRNALAFRVDAFAHLQDIQNIDSLDIFELLRTQQFHYLPSMSERSVADVVVWSFVLVIRKHYVLTYRHGRFREERDSFLHKRSLGFFTPIVEEDRTLFDLRDHGVRSSGLRTACIDLDLPASAIWGEVASSSVLDCFVLTNRTEETRDLLGLILLPCPNWFEPLMRATFDKVEQIAVSGDPFLYELGTYHDAKSGDDRTVILAASSMGKVNAAALTTQALVTFPNIEQIIMAGIAGGCPNPDKVAEHVRLGDVVTVNHLGILEYDNIKETEHGIEIRSTSQKPSAQMLKVAQHLASTELHGQRPWEEHLRIAIGKLIGYDRPDAATDVLHRGSRKVKHPVDPYRRTDQPRIHAGVIATADTLQKNPERRDSLRDKYGVKAIEMEGAGIQGAAWHQGKGIFIIRGICDYCDSHKNDTWQNHAALSAAAYGRAFIEAIPMEWF